MKPHPRRQPVTSTDSAGAAPTPRRKSSACFSSPFTARERAEPPRMRGSSHAWQVSGPTHTHTHIGTAAAAAGRRRRRHGGDGGTGASRLRLSSRRVPIAPTEPEGAYSTTMHSGKPSAGSHVSTTEPGWHVLLSLYQRGGNTMRGRASSVKPASREDVGPVVVRVPGEGLARPGFATGRRSGSGYRLRDRAPIGLRV